MHWKGKTTKKSIVIKGAKEHNLQNIDVTIPRDKFVVITGLSGSGKSSLAFDTMYAEGQRRYVESLSSYARMFLGQMKKPNVESIEGLSPSVSIDQKTTSKNPRSTVGTTTEIFDYLRLLFARVCIPHCPECGREILEQTVDQVTDEILKLAKKSDKAIIMAPVARGKKGEYAKLIADIVKEGFRRVRIDGKIVKLDGKPMKLEKQVKHFIEVVIDRVSLNKKNIDRISEAVELATTLSDGNVFVQLLDASGKLKGKKSSSSGAMGGLDENEYIYSLSLGCPEHGYSLEELQPRDFSFNAPYGACPECSGLGTKNELEESLLVPDDKLSISEGAFVPFKSGNYYPQVLAAVCRYFKESPKTPWYKLSEECKNGILYGVESEKIRVDYHTIDGRNTYWYLPWDGACEALMEKYREAKSDRAKEKFEKYFAVSKCSACNGKRLKPEILAVTINGKSISDICEMTSEEALNFFNKLKFTGMDKEIAIPIINKIRERLKFLVDVGLDYLTLERATSTLSGGEAQRIRLATQIGAGLVGILYILDEPSIGLHQRDNARLIATLEKLRDLGNTVVVVEHDEETIRKADFLVDMGPGAGINGGKLVFAGSPTNIQKCKKSITGQYLSGQKSIMVPKKRRNARGWLKVQGINKHNLHDVNVEIPLSTLTVITGVSGSGKSSLVNATIVPHLANRLNHSKRQTSRIKKITGLSALDKLINIDQSPIGRTPTSNPATYISLWDDIRKLFSSTLSSKAKGYGPGRFSFNVKGGRCEACHGDGQIKIEMHFLPDIYVNCEECNGSRYNRETLQVKFKGKNISDVLNMTVAEALEFFKNIPNIARKLQTLYDVGLSYVRLSQPSPTLSGGEAQRVKIASELQRKQTSKTFYVLDEPTTGLHFEDVKQLLSVLQRLVNKGNTVLVIEHNLDVIKSADHIIDLGPGGGKHGGKIIATGAPEEVAKVKGSETGKFLRTIFGLSS
ncbi:MAG: excinuclease ABC subunit UvrA [Eggerthellaceae bacterium]|nr:excinuclease ABC subunit UvrA [Eggerthellaceae bacterium]